MEYDNPTPGPFPSGKGSKTRRGPFSGGKWLFPTIRFPFPLGKGLGVRLFAYRPCQTGAA
jgi:hypothetical protein